MSGKGPAPYKPSEQRKKPQATVGFKQLPAEGRVGDPPAWPLSQQSAEEQKLWNKLWALPQSVMWEHIRCEDTVALYVRVFVLMAQAESDATVVKLGNEVRQLDSKLGLSPRAMLDLRWEVEHPEETPESTSNGASHRPFVPKST